MTASIHSRRRFESVRTDDYGYANARIRGMRARLLGRERIERLLHSEDLRSVMQELMHSEYTEDLESVLIHGRGAAEIDEGLRHNIVRTYSKVRGFLNSEAYDICSTLLARWDVFNLKTVLRGKRLGLPAAEIRQALVPVGQLGAVELEGLLAATDVRDVVNLASTWRLPQASALRQGFSEFRRTHVLANLELPLDRHYAQWATERLHRRGENYRLGRWILGIQIDNLNLVIVFRAARESLQPEQSLEYFLPGGAQIDLDLYQRLAIMSDVDEILSALRGTRYGVVLDEAVARYLESQSLAVFERALEDYFTRRALSLGTHDPLGAGIAIAYLWAKYNEITNLRIIVKGQSVGLPVGHMRKELILV